MLRARDQVLIFFTGVLSSQRIGGSYQQSYQAPLEDKVRWADKLLSVLWAYRATLHNTTGKTPYFLALGVEAVVLVEVGLPNYHTAHFLPEGNDER